jgi:hypothetical protein
MIANPEPDQAILFHHRERPVAQTDADRIDVILAC